MPVPLGEKASDKFLLARRFSVVQGTKIRPVDDETECGVNKCCQPCEKLKNENIDLLVTAIESFQMQTNSIPFVWKADVDAAYRRIPIRDEDLWAMGIAFKHDNEIWTSQHLATPFGSVGSVHAWHRVGEAISVIAREILRIPLLRYVDDFFSIDRPEVAEHALKCFQRSVGCSVISMCVFVRSAHACSGWCWH